MGARAYNYRKIRILSNGAYFQNYAAARIGAYFHGVLLNVRNFLIVCSCVGTN